MQAFLTTSRVARELHLSEAAVRKLANAGSLPVAAKLSDGTRLFAPEAVTTYARRRVSVPVMADADRSSISIRARSTSREKHDLKLNDDSQR
jgi:hypothetical protein